MIFVTVGTQLPFDRLISKMDELAARELSGETIIAQIGHSRILPRHIEFAQFFSAKQTAELIQGCDVLVCHAGMGTALSRLEVARPMVVLPRRASLREHRNDHQLDTADRLRDFPLVRVVMDEKDLSAEIALARQRQDSESAIKAGSRSESLITALSRFIDRF